LINWGSNCIISRLRIKVKKAANFKAAVWFLAGMQLHWFLKSKLQFRAWLNKLQIKDQCVSYMFLPPFPFKWNDAFWPKRCCFMHCSRKKKTERPKRCRFEWHCGSSSSPGRARQGKKKFFYRLFCPSFSEKHQKDAYHKPTCITSDPWPTTGW